MAPSFLINGSAASTLTPLDRGLAYGDGVFRTLPVQNRRPAHWALHYAKLHADCAALVMACPPAAQLLDGIAALCGTGETAVVKIIVTRGEGERGYATTVGHPVTRIVLKSAFLVMAVAGAATLWMAVVADMGASLIVIGNALRLLRE